MRLQTFLLRTLLVLGAAQMLMLNSTWAAPITLRDSIPGEIRREIADPCLGLHWRLIVDPSSSGKPGRLVLLDQNGTVNGSKVDGTHMLPATATFDLASVLIRAGEHIVVDQDTGVIRARLSAVALESAVAGQRLRVRLIVGSGLSRNTELTAPGPIVSTLATGAGEARWVSTGQTTPPASEPIEERTSR